MPHQWGDQRLEGYTEHLGRLPVLRLMLFHPLDELEWRGGGVIVWERGVGKVEVIGNKCRENGCNEWLLWKNCSRL